MQVYKQLSKYLGEIALKIKFHLVNKEEKQRINIRQTSHNNYGRYGPPTDAKISEQKFEEK